MLILIALGGNALLRRGEALEAEHLVQHSLKATRLIAEVAKAHQVIIVHGNGPQVGLLALQAEAYQEVAPYPFDILNAESQGMIGYLLQQGLNYYLPDRSIATLITRVIVDKDDSAFENPTKPIGPFYSKEEVKKIATERHWKLQQEANGFRRLIPSPKPRVVVELSAICTLLKENAIVIAGGGGGIPCIKNKDGKLVGVEGVIDKDLTASLLAQILKVDRFIILTDVEAVYENWGTAQARPINQISEEVLQKYSFESGSMAPKVEAACQFVSRTLREASIGHLKDLPAILRKEKGTRVIHEVNITS